MQTTLQQPGAQPTTTKKLSWSERRAEGKAEKLAAKIAKASAAPQVQVAAAGPISFYEQALEWTHRADKVINLVLGYLLAIASVLGFMDVLSNGQVLIHIPAAFYVWLAIMGLGVDFQILLVVGRIPDLARNLSGFYKWVFLIFNFAFLAFLGYMSAIIGAVFTQHQDMPSTVVGIGKAQHVVVPLISQAMNVLGIDSTHFVYQRAILATLLLVLMAVDRSMERWRMQIPAYAPVAMPTPAIDVTPVQPVSVGVQTTDMTSLVQTLQLMNQQTLEAMKEMNERSIDRSSQFTVTLLEETLTRLSLTGRTEVRQIEQAVPSSQTTDELKVVAPLETSKGVSTSYKMDVIALAQSEPNLTNEEMASRIGCNVRTVVRWRDRVIVAEV